MFSQSYNNPTCFVTDPSILPNVHVANFQDDKSLAETVKALLYDRIGEETFNAGFYYCDLNAAKQRANGWTVECNTLTYLFLHTEKELNDFRKWAEKEMNMPFISTLDRQSAEIKNKTGFSCSFYNREDDLATLIVCTAPQLKDWHVLQSFFYLCFKPLFVAKPLTSDEKTLILSLTNSSMVRYENAAAKLADRPELNILKLKRALLTIRKQVYDNMIESSKNKLQNLEDKIQKLYEDYTLLLSKVEDETVRLEGAVVLAEKCEEDNELFDYFRNSMQITNVETSAGRISFVVKTFLDVYDPELYREFAKTGNIFNNYSTSYTIEERKLLMDAIFSENPEFRIKVCGYYSLCLEGRVQTCSGYSYPHSVQDRVPNPHLDRHSCLGSYEPEINKFIRSGNIVGAVEQCIASCMSVNMAEMSMTFKPMMSGIFNSQEKILQRFDGTDMTVKETIKYLKEKETNT